jgi:hypothetical protein
MKIEQIFSIFLQYDSNIETNETLTDFLFKP